MSIVSGTLLCAVTTNYTTEFARTVYFSKCVIPTHINKLLRYKAKCFGNLFNLYRKLGIESIVVLCSRIKLKYIDIVLINILFILRKPLNNKKF